jgi:ABC-type transport system involved in multi-copper enzyme maturation permease subunit
MVFCIFHEMKDRKEKTMADRIKYNPVSPPSRSLIGWGAVFAGAFTAFVALAILSTLGLAVGLTGDNSVGMGAAVWSAIAAILSLFLGGWVMSHSEVISSRKEAALHGVVLWGVLLFGLMTLTFSGVQMGLSAVMGVAGGVASQLDLSQLANAAAEIGITSEQLQQLQMRLGEISGYGARSAWWSFLGMIVTLGAVVWGAALGAPSPISQRRRVRVRAPEAEPV